MLLSDGHHGNKSSMELSLSGTEVPSLELFLPGTKVARSESSCYHEFDSYKSM